MQTAAGPRRHEWLFTYGLLRDPRLLRRLLGRVPPGGLAAWLRGYARHTMPNYGGYCYLVPDPQAPPVYGVLWQVSERELRVLDDFEDTDPANPTHPAGDYYRARVQAEAGTGVVECWVYLGGAVARTASDSKR
ncbi:MAG: gamma-glutamylcyclotransferase [Chloroflexi bacterium]|nr:gamma-glutamylcyclotransferase [Chloroflexota bacterium]